MLRVLVSITACFLLAGTVSAHGGKTNSEGCHTKKKTGEYHCHKETPAPLVKEARQNARTEARDDIICYYNAYNCADFLSHTEAQHVFEYCMNETEKDIHDLDRDNDNTACEALE